MYDDKLIDLEERRNIREQLNEPSTIDYDKVFTKTGSRFKYAFVFGHLNKPKTIQIVDGYTEKKFTPEELEKQKQQLMKQLKLPFIGMELTEI